MAATLGLSLPNLAESGLANKFSHNSMKKMMEYMSTYNCESQAVTLSSADITDTATKAVMFNGQPTYLATDTLDISSCTEGTLTAWATATSYSVGDVRSNGGKRYVCVAAHTSRDDSDSDYINNEPGSSDNWAKFWEQRDHGATNASGSSITKAYEQWFLITKMKDGQLSIWEAGDEAASTTGAECKTPQYDPKIYCPVAFLHVKNATSSAFVIGTTALSTASITDSFLQVTGPVFPHPDNWDAN